MIPTLCVSWESVRTPSSHQQFSTLEAAIGCLDSKTKVNGKCIKVREENLGVLRAPFQLHLEVTLWKPTFISRHLHLHLLTNHQLHLGYEVILISRVINTKTFRAISTCIHTCTYVEETGKQFTVKVLVEPCIVIGLPCPCPSCSPSKAEPTHSSHSSLSPTDHEPLWARSNQCVFFWLQSFDGFSFWPRSSRVPQISRPYEVMFNIVSWVTVPIHPKRTVNYVDAIIVYIIYSTSNIISMLYLLIIIRSTYIWSIYDIY